MKSEINFKNIKAFFKKITHKNEAFKKSFQKIPKAILADKLWERTLYAFAFLVIVTASFSVGFFYYIEYQLDKNETDLNMNQDVMLKVDSLNQIINRRIEMSSVINNEITEILPPEVEVMSSTISDSSLEADINQTEIVLPGLESILQAPDFE